MIRRIFATILVFLCLHPSARAVQVERSTFDKGGFLISKGQSPDQQEITMVAANTFMKMTIPSYINANKSYNILNDLGFIGTFFENNSNATFWNKAISIKVIKASKNNMEMIEKGKVPEPLLKPLLFICNKNTTVKFLKSLSNEKNNVLWSVYCPEGVESKDSKDVKSYYVLSKAVISGDIIHVYDSYWKGDARKDEDYTKLVSNLELAQALTMMERSFVCNYNDSNKNCKQFKSLTTPLENKLFIGSGNDDVVKPNKITFTVPNGMYVDKKYSKLNRAIVVMGDNRRGFTESSKAIVITYTEKTKDPNRKNLMTFIKSEMADLKSYIPKATFYELHSPLLSDNKAVLNRYFVAMREARDYNSTYDSMNFLFIEDDKGYYVVNMMAETEEELEDQVFRDFSYSIDFK